jgi:hypothetical protein
MIHRLTKRRKPTGPESLLDLPIRTYDGDYCQDFNLTQNHSRSKADDSQDWWQLQELMSNFHAVLAMLSHQTHFISQG